MYGAALIVRDLDRMDASRPFCVWSWLNKKKWKTLGRIYQFVIASGRIIYLIETSTSNAIFPRREEAWTFSSEKGAYVREYKINHK